MAMVMVFIVEMFVFEDSCDSVLAHLVGELVRKDMGRDGEIHFDSRRFSYLVSRW